MAEMISPKVKAVFLSRVDIWRPDFRWLRHQQGKTTHSLQGPGSFRKRLVHRRGRHRWPELFLQQGRAAYRNHLGARCVFGARLVGRLPTPHGSFSCRPAQRSGRSADFLVHFFDRLSPRFFTRLELLQEAPQSFFWLLLKRANPFQDTGSVLMRLRPAQLFSD